MEYTLSGAAKAVGKSKTTIFRLIRAGRLSATKEEDGTYRIDAAELHRVLQPAPSTETDKQPGIANGTSYQQHIETLKEQVKDLTRRLDQSEAERVAASAEIRRLTLLLMPPDKKNEGVKEGVESGESPHFHGFWSRLFGKST